MAGNGRSTTILLFEAFHEALKQLVLEDEQVLSWSKAKASLAHCLASQLQRSLRGVLGLSQDSASPTYFSLPGDLKVDILTQGCDVLVHDRKGGRTLAVILGNDYLTKVQQDTLHELQNQGCKLVLGAAFLPQKEYVLLYRPNQERMEYLHFHKVDGSTTLLKQRQVEGDADESQLFLGLKDRRKRTRIKKADL
ncbi:MAG: hypothetical protein AB7C91_04835 [Sphaerochaeta sp.]|jgi:hypothetical protein|uniref:hypothetical protein n=1 Tax=Sphaerochaeta sp. TaxID=1972642 RepID=UPI002FCA1088